MRLPDLQMTEMAGLLLPEVMPLVLDENKVRYLTRSGAGRPEWQRVTDNFLRKLCVSDIRRIEFIRHPQGCRHDCSGMIIYFTDTTLLPVYDSSCVPDGSEGLWRFRYLMKKLGVSPAQIRSLECSLYGQYYVAWIQRSGPSPGCRWGLYVQVAYQPLPRSS